MQRPSSVEVLVERLAILDQQIEGAQARIVWLQQRQGHPPVEDIEQTLSVLLGARSVLRRYLEYVQLEEEVPGRKASAPR